MPDQGGAGVQPHPGFRGRGLSVLLQHLHNGLIRMDHGMGQKFLLHVLVQGLQPTLTAPDYPVCHGGAAEGNSFSDPDLFLPGQGQAIHILLGHDVRHSRARPENWLKDRLTN